MNLSFFSLGIDPIRIGYVSSYILSLIERYRREGFRVFHLSSEDSKMIDRTISFFRNVEAGINATKSFEGQKNLAFLKNFNFNQSSASEWYVNVRPRMKDAQMPNTTEDIKKEIAAIIEVLDKIKKSVFLNAADEIILANLVRFLEKSAEAASARLYPVNHNLQHEEPAYEI